MRRQLEDQATELQGYPDISTPSVRHTPSPARLVDVESSQGAWRTPMASLSERLGALEAAVLAYTGWVCLDSLMCLPPPVLVQELAQK